MQQGRDYQAVGSVIGLRAGCTLFHMLRHANRFAHVFLGAAGGEQFEDEVDDAVALLTGCAHERLLSIVMAGSNSELEIVSSKSI
jgi:hypothetical protein